MAVVLITGGTGLVGRALTKQLVVKGHEVIILTRSAAVGRTESSRGVSYAQWNVEAQTIDTDALRKADYIIHLAGAGVAEKRWTAGRKKEIMDSRVQSGQLLVKSLQKITDNNVKAIISASAIGWYGPDKPDALPFTETDPPDSSFLGETCRLWEESITPVTALPKRLVIYRIGIVLSPDGGALKEFVKPFRFGVAAVLGSGRQVISWIHIDDMVRLLLYAIENEKLNGVYNAVAPAPVSNKALILQLARKRMRFFIPIPVPAFLLRLALGEMSVEILKSATVSAAKIQAAGFQFSHPGIDSLD